MLKTLNLTLGEAALEESVLESVFEKWWPDLESQIHDCLKQETLEDKVVLRSQRELLEEILTLLRASYYNYSALFFVSIEDLELDEFIKSRLKKAGIRYIGELIKKTETDLLRYPYNFKIKDIYQIKEILLYRGFQLGMDLGRL
jgi:DNA-directed RNA polymerase alpha subunit